MFLQRAMTVVSMSVMALALAIMVLTKQSFSTASGHELAINTEGDLSGLHSVRHPWGGGAMCVFRGCGVPGVGCRVWGAGCGTFDGFL